MSALIGSLTLAGNTILAPADADLTYIQRKLNF